MSRRLEKAVSSKQPVKFHPLIINSVFGPSPKNNRSLEKATVRKHSVWFRKLIGLVHWGKVEWEESFLASKEFFGHLVLGRAPLDSVLSEWVESPGVHGEHRRACGGIVRQSGWRNMERQREEWIPVWLLSVHLDLQKPWAVLCWLLARMVSALPRNGLRLEPVVKGSAGV